MKILILGGDGYLGWPTAMMFAAGGHEVCVVDNYLRRTLAKQTNSEPLFECPNLNQRADIFGAMFGSRIEVEIGDCTDRHFMDGLIQRFGPDAVVHYAEQPSAPYSMLGYEEARLTLDNNLQSTFNLIWAVMTYAPDCHIIKLGTMGEYGTPDIDIEEGWIEIEHKGRRDRFLYPRAAGSLYHTTKVLDTDLLYFYVRTFGLRVTDLMQGPVYGVLTGQAEADERLLTNFHYDDIFGTVVNRFLVQAVVGVPLTVYGRGGQKRGYLNLNDVMQCVALAVSSPAGQGELRILNQFTETFSVNQLAERVAEAGRVHGLDVRIQHIDNPRKEAEDHYYNPAHSGLLELGLEPTFMSAEILARMMRLVIEHRGKIDEALMMPRSKWT